MFIGWLLLFLNFLFVDVSICFLLILNIIVVGYFIVDFIVTDLVTLSLTQLDNLAYATAVLLVVLAVHDGCGVIGR
mgnify:FL=1